MSITPDADRLRSMWHEHGHTSRSVSLLTRLAILNGGVLAQIGWLVFGFGMIFVQVFGVFDTISGMVQFAGGSTTTTGHYTGSSGTNTNVNDRPVYKHSFTYEVDGEEYEGYSYTTGSWSPGHGTDGVTVEYATGNPDVAVIAGQRYGLVGAFILFTLIFPMIGVFFIVPGLVHGRRANRLLAHGRIAPGELVGKEATGTRINEQRVYKYTFRFTDEAGNEHTATGRTHTNVLSDDAKEPILYDPGNPDLACTVDNLPGTPQITDGEVKLSRSPLLYLILPSLTIFSHGTWAVLSMS